MDKVVHKECCIGSKGTTPWGTTAEIWHDPGDDFACLELSECNGLVLINFCPWCGKEFK